MSDDKKRRVLEEIQPSQSQVWEVDSGSSTEEMDHSGLGQDEWEDLVREEAQSWLAAHGAKLFALEASKFNAQEAKRKNIRSIR